MKVDAREILFIRQNAPRNLMRFVAQNTSIPYTRVRNEFFTLKDDYDEKIVTEARRLLKAISNIEYTPELLSA